MLIKKSINNRLDKQKFIHIYLRILKIRNNNKVSNKEIVDLLHQKFQSTTTEEDIKLYFEPTLYEETLDLRLQMNNLT